MDQTDTLTARAVVNEWPQEELRRILWQYGEERYAPAVAGAIVRARDKRPIETTLELVEVVKGACPLRPCGRNSTRPSGPSRPSASPSTTSWARWTGWCGRRCPG